jgi:pimeloyl-ACP methyl ester carboxylesterase
MPPHPQPGRIALAHVAVSRTPPPDNWFRLLAEDSAHLRKARPGQLDLPFATAEWCRWDLFPAADPNRPCLVLLHGAEAAGREWRSGDRQHCSALAEGLRDHGWAAALPGRGLVPATTPTRIVHETHKALDWLAAQGGRHGVAGPMVVAGWGAGAHLAALALDHPRVVAGLGICGTYMLEASGTEVTELEAALLSPLHLPVAAKPFVVAHDGAETAPAAAAFHAARHAGGGTGRLIGLPGQGTTRLLDSLRAPDGALCRAVLELAG